MPSSIRTDKIKRFNTYPDDINIGDIWLINFPSTRKSHINDKGDSVVADNLMPETVLKLLSGYKTMKPSIEVADNLMPGTVLKRYRTRGAWQASERLQTI